MRRSDHSKREYCQKCNGDLNDYVEVGHRRFQHQNFLNLARKTQAEQNAQNNAHYYRNQYPYQYLQKDHQADIKNR